MKFVHSTKKLDDFLLKFRDLSGAKDCKSCRSRKMLKNAPTLAIVVVHTEENEPPKIWGPKFHYFNPLLSHDSVAKLQPQPYFVYCSEYFFRNQ